MLLDAPDPETIARYVAQNVDAYGRMPYPERPATLDGARTEDLIESWDEYEATGKRTREDAQQHGHLGAWRAAVWSAEVKTAANLRVLLLAVRALSAAAVKHGTAEAEAKKAGDEQAAAELGKKAATCLSELSVVAAALEPYNTDGEGSPECGPYGSNEFSAWCESKVRDLDLLPQELRVMRRAKRAPESIFQGAKSEGRRQAPMALVPPAPPKLSPGDQARMPWEE